MKLLQLYAIALPVAFAMASPEKKNTTQGEYLETQKKERTVDLDRCEGILRNSKAKHSCMRSIFKKMNQMMEGKFPKELKNDITNIVMGTGLPNSPATFPVNSSVTPDPISCSVTGLTFPPLNFVGAGPCDDGMWCRYDKNLFGHCAVCPLAGESCSKLHDNDDDDNIVTVHDYRNCCKMCPGTVCDTKTFIKDLRSKADKIYNMQCESHNRKKPPAEVTTILRVVPLESKSLEAFLNWFDETIEDTRHWPGFLSLDINIEYKNPARGIPKTTVMADIKFDSMEDIRKYYQWRFLSGMWTLVTPWADGWGSGLDFAQGLRNGNTYAVWSGASKWSRFP